MKVQFHNYNDRLRKAADILAIGMFFFLAYYLYKEGLIGFSILMIGCGLADIYFSYDAIKLHGLKNILTL
jgi:hypothetical protein